MRGTAVSGNDIGIVEIAGYRASAEPEMPRCLDEEGRDVPTRPACQRKRFIGRLGALFVPHPIAHGSENAGVQILEKRERVGGRSGLEPGAPGRQTIGDTAGRCEAREVMDIVSGVSERISVRRRVDQQDGPWYAIDASAVTNVGPLPTRVASLKSISERMFALRQTWDRSRPHA